MHKFALTKDNQNPLEGFLFYRKFQTTFIYKF